MLSYCTHLICLIIFFHYNVPNLILGEIIMYKIITMVAVAFFVGACTSGDNVSKNETSNKKVVIGENIHKNSCTKCHTSSVYTREKRTVKSLNTLKKRVAKCNKNVGANLSDKEVASVSDYLNTTYYKFK